MDDLRNDRIALEEQVSRLEEELAAQYLQYRDECDARKLLVIDINDVRNQLEELSNARHTIHEVTSGEVDDPVTLRIGLKWVGGCRFLSSLFLLLRLKDYIIHHGSAFTFTVINLALASC